MKKNILVLFFVLFISFLPAQQNEQAAIIQKIKNEAINNPKSVEYLSYFSNAIGSRTMWSDNFFKAIDWCKRTLDKVGLKNLKVEEWEPIGRGFKVNKFYIQQTSPQFNQLIGHPKTWSPKTNGVIKGKVVYLDSLTETGIKKFHGNLKNAIVLLSPEVPFNPITDPMFRRLEDTTLVKMANYQVGDRPRIDSARNRRRGRGDFTLIPKAVKFCMDEGVAAIVDPGVRTYGTIQSFGATVPFTGDTNRNASVSWSPISQTTIPQFAITMEQYNTLLRQIKLGLDVSLELYLDAEYSKPTKGVNLIGEIPGNELKDEVVIIGAHVDGFSMNTGTLDDAAGVSIMMEAMRILKELNIKPKRTIRIGIWGGEEEGLYGSRAYVQEHLVNKKEKHSVYFNIDNGVGRIRGIYLQENAKALPLVKKWFDLINDPKASTITLQTTGSTDHVSFDRAGFPGFQFIQDPLDYGRVVHTNMDLFDRVPIDDLKENSYFIAAITYLAAMSDQEFPKK